MARIFGDTGLFGLWGQEVSVSSCAGRTVYGVAVCYRVIRLVNQLRCAILGYYQYNAQQFLNYSQLHISEKKTHSRD